MNSSNINNRASRELLSSRLGFILLSAGCAIGLGNVWRFPYIAGQYGGAIFVAIYFICLLVLGIPCVMIELSLGRASQKSIAKALDYLEPKGSKWHIAKYPMILGSYVLMSFYAVITGWVLYYVLSIASGDFEGIVTTTSTPQEIKDIVFTKFTDLLNNPKAMIISTFAIVISAVLICAKGVQKGVEKFSKPIMLILFVLLVALAAYAVTFDKTGQGLSFYLRPDFDKVNEVGWFRVIYEALNQVFFSLGVGIGSMMIFGSYINKRKSLVTESTIISLLDAFVAFTAGLIVFPICFSFGIEVDSGPTLLFESMLSIFAVMDYGRYLGTLFFVFMFFAAFTTIIAIVENIIAITIEYFNVSRRVSVLINSVILCIIVLPCILGFNIWSDVNILGKGTTILDFEDFIVSNNLVPIGAMFFIFFCVFGWGLKNCFAEINCGNGMKLPAIFKYYFFFVLPVIIGVIFVKGYIDKFWN